MNLLSANRSIGPLMLFAYVLLTGILTVVSIKFIYEVFLLVDSYLQASSRQAGQYFTQLINIY
ncbi:MAG TPA: hypothetical protein VK484_12550 [Ferruginibacter sp.]|nr:hypothetical protein [Ferruginibacter sp.]